MNTIYLCGRIGDVPKVHTTEAGTKIVNVSLATNRFFKDKGGNAIENTSWHRVVFFNHLALFVEKHAKKGNKFLVVGSVDYQKYVDSAGIERVNTQIIAESVEILSNNLTIKE